MSGKAPAHSWRLRKDPSETVISHLYRQPAPDQIDGNGEADGDPAVNRDVTRSVFTFDRCRPKFERRRLRSLPQQPQRPSFASPSVPQSTAPFQLPSNRCQPVMMCVTHVTLVTPSPIEPYIALSLREYVTRHRWRP